MIKIVCHTCQGHGFVEEQNWETGEMVDVLCPECGGKGWVGASEWIAEAEG